MKIFMTKEKSYQELKERIRMMKNQRNNTAKVNLIEEGKKIDIDEVTKHNEIINNSLVSQI